MLQAAAAAVGGWADRYPHALGLASQRINPHSQDATAAATTAGSSSGVVTGAGAAAGATAGNSGATAAGELLFGGASTGGIGHLQLPRRPLQQQQGAARRSGRAFAEQQQQQLRVTRPDGAQSYTYTVGDWRQSLADKFQRDMADKVSQTAQLSSLVITKLYCVNNAVYVYQVDEVLLVLEKQC
jgi:hypothetical protein